MKISVLLTSFRAQETIDKAKNLLANLSPTNELEVIVRTSNPDVEGVLKKYLPQDPRVSINTQPTGDVMFMTTDENIGIDLLWDTVPANVAQFLPIEQTPEISTDVENPVDNLEEMAPYAGEVGEMYKTSYAWESMNGSEPRCAWCKKTETEILNEHIEAHDQDENHHSSPLITMDKEVAAIALLMPTRKRPDQMRRVAESAFTTASLPQNVGIFFYIDEDDTESQNMAVELRREFGESRCNFVIGPRIVLSQCWNEAYKIAESLGYDIFMHAGDDLIFRSMGWDDVVRKEFDSVPDKILFLFGNDGFWGQGGNQVFGTHGFVHRKWVETLGYFCPPYFSSDYNDTWLNDVAKMIERWRFNPDIFTEHMHWAFQKAIKDQTYQETEARGIKDQTSILYERMLPQRQEDAEKLRKVMNNA